MDLDSFHDRKKNRNKIKNEELICGLCNCVAIRPRECSDCYETFCIECLKDFDPNWISNNYDERTIELS